MNASSICKHLPGEISKQDDSLNREQFVVDFLQTRLPASDVKGIADELKKTFLFDKVKSNNILKVKPKKGTFLTTRKRQLLGIKNIKSNGQLEYNKLLPMNKLWLEYILQTLGIQSFACLPISPIDRRWETINQKLMKADFHGAQISIVRSKCPSLIGIQGIIIQDTKNTLRIMTEDNVIKTVPKKVVVIKMHLTGATIEFFGKELCIRPAERSVKKFKANHIGEL